MTTLPMPAFPLSRLTTTTAEQPDDPGLEFHGLAFLSKPRSPRTAQSDEQTDEQKENEEILESIRVALISSQDGESSRVCREHSC